MMEDDNEKIDGAVDAQTQRAQGGLIDASVEIVFEKDAGDIVEECAGGGTTTAAASDEVDVKTSSDPIDPLQETTATTTATRSSSSSSLPLSTATTASEKWAGSSPGVARHLARHRSATLETPIPKRRSLSNAVTSTTTTTRMPLSTSSIGDKQFKSTVPTTKRLMRRSSTGGATPTTSTARDSGQRPVHDPTTLLESSMPTKQRIFSNAVVTISSSSSSPSPASDTRTPDVPSSTLPHAKLMRRSSTGGATDTVPRPPSSYSNPGDQGSRTVPPSRFMRRSSTGSTPFTLARHSSHCKLTSEDTARMAEYFDRRIQERQQRKLQVRAHSELGASSLHSIKAATTGNRVTLQRHESEDVNNSSLLQYFDRTLQKGQHSKLESADETKQQQEQSERESRYTTSPLRSDEKWANSRPLSRRLSSSSSVVSTDSQSMGSHYSNNNSSSREVTGTRPPIVQRHSNYDYGDTAVPPTVLTLPQTGSNPAGQDKSESSGNSTMDDDDEEEEDEENNDLATQQQAESSREALTEEADKCEKWSMTTRALAQSSSLTSQATTNASCHSTDKGTRDGNHTPVPSFGPPSRQQQHEQQQQQQPLTSGDSNLDPGIIPPLDDSNIDRNPTGAEENDIVLSQPTEVELAEIAIARLVPNEDRGHDPDNVYVATRVDVEAEKKQRMKRRRRLTVAFVVLSIIILSLGATVIIVVLSQKDNDDNDEGDSNPDASDDSIPDGADGKLADVPADICMERVPGQGWGDVCSGEQTKRQGGGVANLVAQARLNQITIADISILNAGEVRSDIRQGIFTREDTGVLLPFENKLVMIDLSGADVVRSLEEGIEYLEQNNATGAYLYAAGIRFGVNFTATFPNRFFNVEVNERLMHKAWTAINLTKTYTVVTNSFLASGGDGHQTFLEADPAGVRTSFTDSTASFNNYCIWKKILTDPSLEEYSTQAVVGSTLACETCVA